MKFRVPKTKTNIMVRMKSVGYSFLRKSGNQLSFAKSLSRGGYPRFHIYLTLNEGIEINLHLDQKKPVYSGTTAHGGEYEGDLVEKEVDRLKKEL